MAGLPGWMKGRVAAGAVGVVGSGGTFLVLKLFGLTTALAVLIVVALVLLVVIFLLFRQLQKAKAADEIEQTIGRQADRDIERSSPGQQKSVQDLKADLLEAIAALKKAGVGGRRGKDALSVLPWYLVLGPAGSGKSAMLSRSGLHFPLLDEGRRGRAVKGVGGTRSFEWWLSQEAVVLDLGGRALAAAGDFEDLDDWHDFLDVLRRQRQPKPLNGVFLAFSLGALADASDAQIDKLAAGVRERLGDLVQRLGVVFPVYVVFTKSDQMAGFAEFFADLPPGDRVQPWGATLALDEESREAPAEARFDAEFDQLMNALSDRRFEKLSQIPDALQRARAFAFPVQLERARAAMRRLLRGAFAPDPTREGALFRGFYLTSALQEGTPVDRVLEPASRAIGAAAPAAQPPALPPGAYFVHDLLTKVAFPDASLAALSRNEVAAQKRRRMFVLGGLGVAFLAIALLLVVFGFANGRLVGETKRAASEVAERVGESADLMQNLEKLEALRVRLAAIDSLRTRRPLWRTLGAWSGGSLLEPGVRLYTEKALESVVAPAARVMKVNVDTLTSHYSGEFAEYYALFRSWRLLAKPGDIVPDDAPILAHVVNRLAAPAVEQMPMETRDRVPELIRRQMAFLAGHADAMDRIAAAYYKLEDPELVRRGQLVLRERWDPSSFYRLMIDQVKTTAPPAEFAALVPKAEPLKGAFQVPGPWTRDAWEQQVRPRIEHWRALMQRDWVVGESFGGKPPDLAADLLTLYGRDYTANWSQFLMGVGLEGVGDMTGAAEMLKTFSSDKSPILDVIKAVSKQTALGTEAGTGLAQVSRDFGMLHNFSRASGDAVAQTRAKLPGWLGGTAGSAVDKGSAPSAQYLAQMQGVRKQVASAAQPGAPLSEMEKLMTYGDENSNEIKSALSWIERYAASYPGAGGGEATVRLLRVPIDVSKAPTAVAISGELATKWALLVATPFQKTLLGKYPVADSPQEASEFEFNEFFKPGGTIWSFYDGHLKSYILPDGSPVNPAEPSQAVPNEIVNCIRKAHAIREALYAGGADRMKLAFSVQTGPPEGQTVPIRRISLDVGGKPATYQMGPPEWLPLEWPGADPNVGATLRILGSTSAAESRNHLGLWGLFRLIDQGQFQGDDGGVPRVAWKIPGALGDVQVTYLFQVSAARHPFSPGFLRIEVPGAK